jgi:hypothetical protein
VGRWRYRPYVVAYIFDPESLSDDMPTEDKMNNNFLFLSKTSNNLKLRLRLTRLSQVFMILALLISLIGIPTGNVKAASTISFTGEELLGRPEDTSITINIVPDSAISLYYEYGTTSGVYTTQTSTVSATAGQPVVVKIAGLMANTKYYYRMRYQKPGDVWIARDEHSFWTQRAAGSTYSFDITSDGHVNIMLGNATTWTQTLNDVANDHPDFEIDLGDTVAMDDVSVGDVTEAENVYKFVLPFFNIVSASSPIFLSPGNHEQQEGWHLTASNTGGNPQNSLPVLGTNAQNKYFLNPVPNAFYSGDADTYSYLDGDHLRKDYYAWTWGDALFVVIDPFWFSTTKPYVSDPGGGENDTTGSGDSWDWTLGLTQFNWLKTTLQGSDAKYKFVFTHQMAGGGSVTGQADYGHGGANYANLVEWGGYNENGTTLGWDTNRNVAQWGNEPVHQIMKDNGVTAFFHGHDHQYAYEKLDGIVYQAVPSASFTGSFGIYTTGSGNTIWADSTQGAGHLHVTVGPSQTTVDFIKTGATSPAYTYTMAPTGGPSHTLTTAVNPSGAGTTTPEVGTHSYVEGTLVTVTAAPASGYAFDHWSGACTGTGTCQVTMDADKTVTAMFSVHEPGPLSLDGVVSSNTADGVKSINVPHTTGTGTDRLMLVGVSANTYNTTDPISSVTFTPNGGSATALSLVGSIENEAGRLATIYSLLNPPSGVSGTVTVTFSNSVGYGIVAGVANFAGVNQSDPLDDFVSAVGTEAAPLSVDVPADPNDLVFDTVFLGAQTPPSLTADASQTQLWNATVDRVRGVASIEEATASSTHRHRRHRQRHGHPRRRSAQLRRWHGRQPASHG